MPAQRKSTTLRVAQKPTVPSLFFAPCPRGLEVALSAELTTLGAADVRAVEGGVGFGGDLRLCYRANLESRIASRVLWRLGEWAYQREEDVYRQVAALRWRDHFDPCLTIRVNVAAIASPLRSLDFITLRIKDAVCDRFRADTGTRPSVVSSALSATSSPRGQGAKKREGTVGMRDYRACW